MAAKKKQTVRKGTSRPAPKKSKAAPRKAAAESKRTVARSSAGKAGRPSRSAKPVAKVAPPAKKKASVATTPRKTPVVPSTRPPARPSPHSPARVGATRGGSDLRPVTSSVGLIHGIPPYQAKAGERYMNERQLEHFRQILLAWKRELMEEVDRTVHHMQDEASNFPDPNDRATQESEFGLELRTRDRERKLLKKIDSALERIEDGSYGYCEETGEEIGLRRLEARPVATLSVEAQERREVAERQFRDREDGY